MKWKNAEWVGGRNGSTLCVWYGEIFCFGFFVNFKEADDIPFNEIPERNLHIKGENHRKNIVLYSEASCVLLYVIQNFKKMEILCTRRTNRITAPRYIGVWLVMQFI